MDSMMLNIGSQEKIVDKPRRIQNNGFGSVNYWLKAISVILVLNLAKYILKQHKPEIDTLNPMSDHRALSDTIIPIVGFEITRNGSFFDIQGNPCDYYSKVPLTSCIQQLNIVMENCEDFLKQIHYDQSVMNRYDPNNLGQDPSIQAKAGELKELPNCVYHTSDKWPEFLGDITKATPVDDDNEPDAEAVPIPDGGEGATNTTVVNGTSIAVGSGANSTDTGSNSTTSVPIGVPVSGPGNGTNSNNSTAVNGTSIAVGPVDNSTNTGSNSTTFVPTGLPVPPPVNNVTDSNNSTVVNGTDDSGNSGIMINSNNPVTFTPTGLPTQMPIAAIVPVSYQNGTYQFQANPCDKYGYNGLSRCSQQLTYLKNTCRHFFNISGITIPGNSDPFELQKNNTINSVANDLQNHEAENCLTYNQENGDKWKQFLSIVATIQSFFPTSFPTGGPTGQPSGGPTGQPSGGPTGQPSGGPTGQPSGGPTGQPSGFPTIQPVLFLGNVTNSNSTDTGGNSTTPVPTHQPVIGPVNNGTNFNSTDTGGNSTTPVPTHQPVIGPVNNGTNFNSTDTGGNSTTPVPTHQPVIGPVNNGTDSNSTIPVDSSKSQNSESGNENLVLLSSLFIFGVIPYLR